MSLWSGTEANKVTAMSGKLNGFFPIDLSAVGLQLWVDLLISDITK
jgi:hypothetical protein